jgi:hypothetical protein
MIGGDAELEYVDLFDPFAQGINFSVRPPKKSSKQITNGGEKTLASWSSVFALHRYKPTPLHFMDEIDATLDFRNVSIIANYIKEGTRNAPFIIISLRNHMMCGIGDLLLGIFKNEDVSNSVSVGPTKSYSPVAVGNERVHLEAGAPAAPAAAVPAPKKLQKEKKKEANADPVIPKGRSGASLSRSPTKTAAEGDVEASPAISKAAAAPEASLAAVAPPAKKRRRISASSDNAEPGRENPDQDNGKLSPENVAASPPKGHGGPKKNRMSRSEEVEHLRTRRSSLRKEARPLLLAGHPDKAVVREDNESNNEAEALDRGERLVHVADVAARRISRVQDQEECAAKARALKARGADLGAQRRQEKMEKKQAAEAERKARKEQREAKRKRRN